MQSIFNYNTLNARLDKSTRTIIVELNRESFNNAINMELLFELESLLAWVSNKVEIHTLLFVSTSKVFSIGHNPKTLPDYNANQIEKMTLKLQKLVQALLHLPQTIICDLQEGASNIACELAIGADLRISHENAKVSFNHSQLGLVPSSCGMSAFTTLIGQMNARNFVLTGEEIPMEQLKSSGFVYKTYTDETREKITRNLLVSINSQAPVQRIQTKHGLFENIRESFEHSMKIENQISKAARMTEDWKMKKTKDEDQSDFMPSKSMSYSVKLSLVEDKENNLPLN